ncbi:MAG: hypothetical protein OEM78_17250 [Gammaproteobacteria bacterium]|nr:hypothetical protein [Gammaproteobacteria bacterium]
MAALRTREIFSDATVTLIAVESIDLQTSKTNMGCHVYASIKPVAVIVRSLDGTYALDMEAKPTPLEQFRQYVPELNSSGH